MKADLSIELEKLRKVYPRQLSGQLSSVLKAAMGKVEIQSGGNAALDELDLSVRQGERIGIIGSNGAGKSTLLQMLAGITAPTSGQMRISGKVTAVLTLGTGLREDLSGRENIYLDGEAQGKSRSELEADVTAIVDFAELGRFIDLPIRTYSTGMKARLAFGMITQINPEILIIDEALSVGDAAFAVKAGKRIAELCGRGAIVLIVSHSMQSIRELCNRCLWLDGGKLVQDGSPEVVTRAYLEAVRNRDEMSRIERFRSLVGAKSFASDFWLSELTLSVADEPVHGMSSGQSLRAACTWKQPETQVSGRFILRCIRLDGTLICEHSIDQHAEQGKQELRMTYPCFNVAPGIYRFHVEWNAPDGMRRAETANVLEVIAEDIPAGGRPVLVNVGHIESVKIKGTV